MAPSPQSFSISAWTSSARSSVIPQGKSSAKLKRGVEP